MELHDRNPGIPANVKTKLRTLILLHYADLGCLVSAIEEEYKSFYNEDIHPTDFGFPSWSKLIASVPDELSIRSVRDHRVIVSEPLGRQVSAEIINKVFRNGQSGVETTANPKYFAEKESQTPPVMPIFIIKTEPKDESLENNDEEDEVLVQTDSSNRGQLNLPVVMSEQAAIGASTSSTMKLPEGSRTEVLSNLDFLGRPEFPKPLNLGITMETEVQLFGSTENEVEDFAALATKQSVPILPGVSVSNATLRAEKRKAIESDDEVDSSSNSESSDDDNDEVVEAGPLICVTPARIPRWAKRGRPYVSLEPVRRSPLQFVRRTVIASPRRIARRSSGRGRGGNPAPFESNRGGGWRGRARGNRGFGRGRGRSDVAIPTEPAAGTSTPQWA